MPDRRGKVEVVTDLLFLGSWIIVDGDCSHEIRRWLLLSRKVMTNLDSVLKSRDITLLIKGPYSQGYSLPSGHVQVWDLDHKEGRTQKNWCILTVVPEKTLESPLDSKGIKPVNDKGNQPFILIGRTDAEAEAPAFWSSDANRWLIGKVPDAQKDWGQKRKRESEDELAGWHSDARDMNLGELHEMMRRQSGMLQSMGWQRVRHDWVTEQQWWLHFRYLH